MSSAWEIVKIDVHDGVHNDRRERNIVGNKKTGGISSISGSRL
jgi:hypothetical protein